jgi:hypothetical protein
MEPQIITADAAGVHNDDLDASARRLLRSKTYRDLSTVCVIPCLSGAGIAPRVVERWMALMAPMNQPFLRMFVTDMEVGAAYETAVAMILEHPTLKSWKYLLTLEHDNMPPPDGLLRLYESIDGYAAVGGLYWTKGPEGQPMIYGDPVGPLNFAPQVPRPGELQECNGLGMGFTLFDLDVFRQLERPWFQTLQHFAPNVGARVFTQDLFFFDKARKAGHKVACDTRVRVGHFDRTTGVVW